MPGLEGTLEWFVHWSRPITLSPHMYTAMLIFTPLLALAALVAAQVPPLISIPDSIVQCQATQINWTTSYPPVSIIIYSSDNPGTTLADLGSLHSGTSVTWIANVQAGTEIYIMITDSRDAVSIAKPSIVHPGSSDCLGADTGGNTATPTGSPVGTGDSSWPTVPLNAASSDVKVGLSGLLGLVAVAVMV